MNCSIRPSSLRRPFQMSAGSGTNTTASGAGALTISDSDSQARFEFDVPGFSTDDITIDLQDGRLIVSGEIAATEEGGKVVYSERCGRTFRRVVRLSDKLDPLSADAELRDGVLTLSFARKPDAERRRIEVRSASVATE